MEGRDRSVQEGGETGEGSHSATLAAGTLIAGFLLKERLSDGGMGVIWSAHELALNRTVALKFLRPELLHAQHALERFRREAMAAARTHHPGIVTVYSIGEAEGQPYIAQELVPGGRTLGHLIAEGSARGDHGRAWFRRAAELAFEAADALHSAHEAGVVHRDVKPHNLLLTPEGHVKVADFGLARLKGLDTVTESGVALGTSCYMSPEQVRAEHELDSRADVFGLGATLYELLTFRRAFDGDSANAIIHKVLNVDPPDARKLSSHVPRELALVCTKALEKRAADRFASMRDFADELRRYLAGEPLRIHPPSTVHRMRKWVRRHPAWSFSSAVGLFALCAVTWMGVTAAGARRGRLAAERDSLHTHAQWAIELDDLERAAELVAQASELDPEDYTGNLILAAGYAKYQRTPEAEREIESARAKGFSSEPAEGASALEHGGRGLYLYSLDDPEQFPQAEEHMMRALELDPSLYALQYPLYRMRRQRGDVAGARAALKELRGRLGSAEPFIAVVGAIDQELAGDVRAAIATLEELSQRSGIDDAKLTELRWHRNMGRLCARAGELERAEEFLQRATEDVPSDFSSWNELAALYVKRWNPAEWDLAILSRADAAAEHAQRLNPTDPEPLLVRAWVAVARFGAEAHGSRETDDASREAAREALDALAATSSPEAPWLESRFHVLEARDAFQNRRYAEAASSYELALEADEGAVEAAALLGQCYWHLGRHAEGLEALTRGLEAWDEIERARDAGDRWLGILLCWSLGHAARLEDVSAMMLARDRLLSELERGAVSGKEELISAAEFLSAEAPAALRDCELAHRLVEQHGLRTAFVDQPAAAEAARILARIDAACP